MPSDVQFDFDLNVYVPKSFQEQMSMELEPNIFQNQSIGLHLYL